MPCSLRSLVLDLYAPDTNAPPGQALNLNAVLGYLRAADTSEMAPLEAIVTRAEAMGDPGLLSTEHVALLDWLNVAFTYWEEQFPVEQPLASEFRKLLPLLGAQAISDPDFLTPGAHSLHLLLDTFHASVIGWQARLGRAGQGLEREVVKTIARANAWLEDDSVDLSAVHNQVFAVTQKDRGRAKRLAQRAIEAEQGRIKITRAKLQAGKMINTQLARYLAPTRVGDFLKGPWYESAQLVLLRFGENSSQWAGMSTTTEALLDSIQSGEESSEEQSGSRRQQVFEAITRLPRELKRWLLSLQHDNHGVDEAMSIIELAHMAVLRQQDLKLQTIEPIPVENVATRSDDRTVEKSIAQQTVGQWFLIAAGNSEPIRAQLVLKTVSQQQLLFTNQAGIKVFQKHFAAFAQDLDKGKARPLYSGASFSISLAHAAKISSQRDVDSLNSSAAIQARPEHRAAIKRRRAKEETARAQAQREREEQEQLRKEFDNAIQEKRDREIMQREREIVQREREEEEQRRHVQRQAQRATERAEAEKQATERAAQKPEESFLSTPDVQRVEGNTAAIELEKIGLIMGAWLGFHDGDKPLLAKLAAHDRERDNYIFVNRNGIKMRELTRQELNSLVNRELIEILEARSSFEEEDTRARHQHKD